MWTEETRQYKNTDIVYTYNGIVIGSIVLVFIIAAVIVYRSFAFYEEEKSCKNMFVKLDDLKTNKNGLVALLKMCASLLYYLKEMLKSKEIKQFICSCKTNDKLLHVVNQY